MVEIDSIREEDLHITPTAELFIRITQGTYVRLFEDTQVVSSDRPSHQVWVKSDHPILVRGARIFVTTEKEWEQDVWAYDPKNPEDYKVIVGWLSKETVIRSTPARHIN